eukprot:11211641-Lingulodinium_polyedra.AAC.1
MEALHLGVGVPAFDPGRLRSGPPSWPFAASAPRPGPPASSRRSASVWPCSGAPPLRSPPRGSRR